MTDKEFQKLTKGVLGKDKKLKAQIKNAAYLKKQTQKSQKINDILLAENSGYIQADENEDLLRFRQKDLMPLLPIMNAEKIFDLKLDYGRYYIDFDRPGNYLALAGSKGHIAILNWKTKNLKCEFNVKEAVRDIKFLHNETLYAVAQKNYLYIYDHNGIEVHRLKSHPEPRHLEYLPYHYLLTSLSQEGLLSYRDISTGEIASEHKTNIKEAGCMIQNPNNAIILIGDTRGQITMWCPNTGVPLVKILCHKTSINGASVDKSGNYLVTTGSDSKMKVWDVRTYKLLYEYWNPMPAKTVSISQKGLLAIGFGSQVQIWKDWAIEKQKKPYLKHEIMDDLFVNDLNFVPYEDYLGIGTVDGFSTIVVPGSGEANFDSFEVNVFQTKNQRKEADVVKLLDKIPSETITLDPNIIGNIDRASKEVLENEKKGEKEEAERIRQKNKKKREKARGRSSTAAEKKQKDHIWDEKTRNRLKEIVDSKIKMRRIEKEKLKSEANMLHDDKLLSEFDPLVVLKKIKKD